MTDTKISALTELDAVPAVGDWLALVDVSDTTMAASGTTKKINADRYIYTTGTANTLAASLDVNSNNLTGAGTVSAGSVIASGIVRSPTVNGGTASAGSVVINSTSHATKGKIYFGTASVYDQANKRLGIGTVSPAGVFEAVGSLGTFSIDANGAQFNFSRDNVNYFKATTAGGTFLFIANGLANAFANASIYCDTSQQVGIGGVASMSYILDVNGAAHASSFPTSSDQRLKEGLLPVSNVLTRLQSISAYTFVWKEGYAAGDQFRVDKNDPTSARVRQLGFLAQEVAAEFPELVTRWRHRQKRPAGAPENGPRLPLDLDDALSVDYGRMVPIVVQGIRELVNEIDLLKARVTALESA